MCYIHRYIHVEEIISAKYVCMIDTYNVNGSLLILNKTLYVFPRLAIIK